VGFLGNFSHLLYELDRALISAPDLFDPGSICPIRVKFDPIAQWPQVQFAQGSNSTQVQFALSWYARFLFAVLRAKIGLLETTFAREGENANAASKTWRRRSALDESFLLRSAAPQCRLVTPPRATGDFPQTFFTRNVSDAANVSGSEIPTLERGVADAEFSGQLFARVPNFAVNQNRRKSRHRLGLADAARRATRSGDGRYDIGHRRDSPVNVRSSPDTPVRFSEIVSLIAD
jgi:hypothetical protein